MLSFKHGSSFGLQLLLISTSVLPVEIRGMTKEGPFNYKIVPNGLSTAVNYTFTLPDIPIMVSVSVFQTAGSTVTNFGQLYLTVNGNRCNMLTQGEFSTAFSLSWPNSPEIAPVQAVGTLQRISIGTTSAGNDIDTVIPDNQCLDVVDIDIPFTASAAVANRTIKLQCGTLGTGQHYLVRTSGTAITASQTVETHFIPGGTTGIITAGAAHEVALPQRVLLRPGTQIATVTTNLQAADQFGECFIIARRIFQPT
jgi:hypothetical protein